MNYNKLRKRWLNLIPNDEIQMMEIVRLVVKKAMDEPMYMQIYARLFGYALSKKPIDIECMLRNNLILHIHNCLQVFSVNYLSISNPNEINDISH